MTDKAALLEARNLIKAKRYQEARRLLETLDNATARDWLAKLDSLTDESRAAPPAARQPNPFLTALRVLIGGVLALVVIGGALAFLNAQFGLDEFFRSEAQMRLRAPAAIFVGMIVGFLVSFDIRLIGRAHGGLLGLFSVLVTALALVIGHFGGHFLALYEAQLATSPLDETVIAAYLDYATSLPNGVPLIYATISLFALGIAWIVGAAGEESFEKAAE